MNSEKKNIYIFSQEEKLRFYILEHTIHIEELICETIGHLLGIDWENSKSFGFSSSSLSFNQKAQIILDLKGIEKSDFDKLTCLMNIRNKFAHVREIETFEDLFTKTGNGKNLKKSLEKWYKNENVEYEDEYRYYFFSLADDIAKMLFKVSIDFVTKQVKKKTRNDFYKYYSKYLREKLEETSLGKNGIDEILNKVKTELKNNPN